MRPENKAPIRTFKLQQQCEEQPSRIVPHSYPAKKSASRSKAAINHAKLNHEKLIHLLGTSNQHNLQIRKKSGMAINASGSSKKLSKSPNLKIYATRRYGSSASSSRSSIFRNHDEKRRHRQPYQSQLNFLVRSFHSGHLADAYAKYLVPSRNQQLKGNLGSLPEAMKVSLSIQNDLMIIDAVLRNRISVGGGNRKTLGTEFQKPLETDRLQAWKHPPPLEKYPIKSLAELMSSAKVIAPLHREQKKQSLEANSSRGYSKKASKKHLKNLSPLAELLLHDREGLNNELMEKHRRSRMKKLGLVKDSPKPSEACIKQYLRSSDNKPATETSVLAPVETNKAGDGFYTKSSPLSKQVSAICKTDNFSHNRRNSRIPVAKTTKLLLVQKSPKLHKKKSNRSMKLQNPPSDVQVSYSTSQESTTLPKRSTDGPLAMATANLIAKKSHGYRYKRDNHFAMGKY